MCCQRAPTILLHVNLLIALYVGAGLATGARLKWDPSAYVPLRALAPVEYRTAAVLLPALALAALLAAHLAVLAVTNNSTRLYVAYAICCVILIILELGAGAWVALRVRAWLRSEEASELQDALELREHIAPLLDALSKWHPIPDKIRAVVKEAELDAPRNGYVAGAAAAVLLVLQILALVLSVLAAVRPTPGLTPDKYSAMDGVSRTSSEDRVPLKSAYKNGRLVLL